MPPHPDAPAHAVPPLASIDELLALGDAFLELAHDWRILRVNAAQERLSRTPRDRSLGRVFWEVWPEAATPDSLYWREYHRCRDERVAVHFEEHFEPLDLWTGVTAFPLSTGGIAIFFRDITEQKQADEALRAALDRAEDANERLREADRKKDEFLGMLSHELRNPLAPIRNSLFILDRAEPGSDVARRAREVANRQVGHLARLVDDLLDVTRVARNKIELVRSPLDLAALVRRSAEDYRASMRERGLALEVDVPPDPVVVVGDETRLGQVFWNLLSNAAKFTPAGGTVVVALEVRGEQAGVRVRDTGVGIEPRLLDEVFEPFTQGTQTPARSEGGLGLGLALVKGLTELHGGAVRVASTPGQGTEFTVELPLAVDGGRQPT
ncbi:MAG: ATP-binding protein [Anaeromyxobacteraceae bacterium]